MTVLVPEFLPVNTYVAARLRRVFEAAPIQEGIYDVGDLKVTQRAAGANKSVDIAAGRAWVRGDDTARQGSYHCENDGVVNLTIPDNSSGNPRIDSIILHVYDSSVIGGGTNAAILEVLQGAPTASATVDNRLGAAALPATAIRVADIPVASGFTSITTAIIRDRRPWVRGAFNRIARTANASAGSNYTTVATSMALIDGANLQPRIECSGVPLRVTLSGFHSNSGANFNTYAAFLDGVAGEPGATDVFSEAMVAGSNRNLSISRVLSPAAGSHLVGWAWHVNAGTATLVAAAAAPLEMTIEEIVRQNTANT